MGISKPKAFESHVTGKQHGMAWGHGALKCDPPPHGSGHQPERTGSGNVLPEIAPAKGQRHGHKITLNECRYGVCK